MDDKTPLKKKQFMNISELYIRLEIQFVKETIKNYEMFLVKLVKAPESPEKTEEIEEIRKAWINAQKLKETLSFKLKTGNFDTPFTKWEDYYFKDKFESKLEEFKKNKQRKAAKEI